MNYQPPTVELAAPYQRGGKTVLGAKFELSSGDCVKLEAELTPETIRRAQNGGAMVVDRLRRWMRSSVTLRGDWSSYGPMARAIGGVVAATAAEPALNLPQLTASDKDKSHPAYRYARELLASDGYAMFDRLRNLACRDGARPEHVELFAACCHLGNCCCGKKLITSCYDASWLLDHPWACPHKNIARAAADTMASRSYRSIFE